jgi:hypothetical protein
MIKQIVKIQQQVDSMRIHNLEDCQCVGYRETSHILHAALSTMAHTSGQTFVLNVFEKSVTFVVQ